MDFEHISTVGGCWSVERTDFEQFVLWGCGGLERTDFATVSTLGGCSGQKELILNSFTLGRVGRS